MQPDNSGSMPLPERLRAQAEVLTKAGRPAFTLRHLLEEAAERIELVEARLSEVDPRWCSTHG